MTDPRRSQAIQAAAGELAIQLQRRGDDAVDPDWLLVAAAAIVDAVLASLPPAEPQEGERARRCDKLTRLPGCVMDKGHGGPCRTNAQLVGEPMITAAEHERILANAVMNTAQLDMLRRCHEDRTALKQQLRDAQPSPDPVRVAGELLSNQIMSLDLLPPTGKADHKYVRVSRSAWEWRRLMVAHDRLRAALVASVEPKPNVTEAKLQHAIDRAFGDDPQQALVCVVEWLESIVYESPGEGQPG